MIAAGTDHAADAEGYFSIRSFQEACVIAVDRKAARMPAGACQAVELQVCDKIIISCWCYGVVIFDKKGYHDIAGNGGFCPSFGNRQETKLWSGRFLPLLSGNYVIITKGTG